MALDVEQPWEYWDLSSGSASPVVMSKENLRHDDGSHPIAKPVPRSWDVQMVEAAGKAHLELQLAVSSGAHKSACHQGEEEEKSHWR